MMLCKSSGIYTWAFSLVIKIDTYILLYVIYYVIKKDTYMDDFTQFLKKEMGEDWEKFEKFTAAMDDSLSSTSTENKNFGTCNIVHEPWSYVNVSPIKSLEDSSGLFLI